MFSFDLILLEWRIYIGSRVGVHNKDRVIFPIRKLPFTLNRRNLEVKYFISPLITYLNTHGFDLSCCLFSLNLAKFETRATVVKFCVFSKQIYSLFYPFWHQSVKHISNRNTFYKMISRMSASYSAQKCAPSKYKRNSRELRPISSGLTRHYLFIFKS